MTSPATLGAISIGTTLIGGGLGAAGAAGSAGASSSSFLYKAGIAKLNADIDRQNAAWSLNQGGIKAANYGLKAGQEIADTKVIQAQGGLDVNTGSKAAVRDAQGDVARYDEGLIRAEALHTATGYENKARANLAEASMDVAASENAQKAGRLGILSSLIGAAGSVAGKWTQGNTIGMWQGPGQQGPIGTFTDGGNSGGTPNWSY